MLCSSFDYELTIVLLCFVGIERVLTSFLKVYLF